MSESNHSHPIAAESLANDRTSTPGSRQHIRDWHTRARHYAQSWLVYTSILWLMVGLAVSNRLGLLRMDGGLVFLIWLTAALMVWGVVDGIMSVWWCGAQGIDYRREWVAPAQPPAPQADRLSELELELAYMLARNERTRAALPITNTVVIYWSASLPPVWVPISTNMVAAETVNTFEDDQAPVPMGFYKALTQTNTF